MANIERVFALHDFEAENPDEVSFKAGEPVVVVEKDDAYGDGWWQGTNTKGETGLFPFSYTTFDAEVARGAALNGQGPNAEGGKGPTGKVMNSTMADIDEALAGLRTGNTTQSKDAQADRQSLNSEQTGDFSVGGTEENGGDAEDEYEARAKARAALAVNAARNQEDAEEAEKAEQAKMKAQALKVFEAEEEKQRQLLLQREEERKVAAAEGRLQEEERPKVAPIPGLDMSDESDSEGSNGPYLDDGAATHAPLFGGPIASPNVSKSGASEALRDIGASPNQSMQPESALSSAQDYTPKDAGSGALERQQQQARSLSPIPSISAHSQGPTSGQTALFAGASAAAAAGVAAGSAKESEGAPKSPAPATASSAPASGSAVPVMTRMSDERSFDSSKGQTSLVGSPAPAASSFGGVQNGTSVGTAPTSFVGSDTPKSQNTTTQPSPSPSVTGSRPAAPGGDPHDWTVDQVVEWGRSKGWDEVQIVSKFAEHEISGDVLMEMDVNILKEIDIIAFGKRFQVANAIKELKKGMQGDAASWSPMPDNGVSPVTGMSTFQNQQQRSVTSSSDPPSSAGHQFALSGVPGIPGSVTHGGMAGVGAGLAAASAIPRSQTPQPTSSSRFDIVQPSNEQDASSAGWTQSSLGSPMTTMDQEVMSEGEGMSQLASLKKEVKRGSRRQTSHNDNSLSHVPISPRKRESGGSGKGNAGDRTSFFAGFNPQKGRKPAPKLQSQNGSFAADADGSNKGTFSRLGFNRLKPGANASADTHSSTQDLRNRISLPTSSPTYDSMGDTARRNRASQQSSGSGNGPPSSRSNVASAGAFGGHQKQASVGSAGVSAADWHRPVEPKSPGGAQTEGPVMLRIRPVDYEGWMRKKGERYNTWKPRYLALKGSDLVLLRDPTAAKIKGYVSMKGYKVIADENTNPGKYGFKILHETEKPHYFSSDDAIIVREWMKALMKATIGRDTSLPVISSYNNATISLKEAQRMNPPPRPPSPTSRARAQRATARANKDQLTAKDASVLMGLHQTNDARQMGFIVQDEMSPLYNEWEESKHMIPVEEGGNNRRHPSLEKCLMVGRASQDSLAGKTMGRALQERQMMGMCAGPSPAEQDGAWVPLDGKNMGRLEGKVGAVRVAAGKHIAPLMTHGHLTSRKGLPVLESTSSHAHPAVLLSSPPPPSPLPKSGESDTMGCADLPAPPPPSHSPDHKSRIQLFHLRRKAQRVLPDPSLPALPTAAEQTVSPVAPTPISKGGTTASSYPTLSAQSEGLLAWPSAPSLREGTGKQSGKKRLLRPRSAGEGSLRSPKLHYPSLASMPGGAASAGAERNSFIVFSVSRGSRSSMVGTQASRQSDYLQLVQEVAGAGGDKAGGEDTAAASVALSSSVYSNNNSVLAASPEEVSPTDSRYSRRIWAPFASTCPPSRRASGMDVAPSSASLSELFALPPLPKTAAFPVTTGQATAAAATCADMKSHRRRSSFDGLFRPRKEDLHQDSMNKPSWFKFTRDREMKRQVEEESELKIAKAEREMVADEGNDNRSKGERATQGHQARPNAGLSCDSLQTDSLEEMNSILDHDDVRVSPLPDNLHPLPPPPTLPSTPHPHNESPHIRPLVSPDMVPSPAPLLW